MQTGEDSREMSDIDELVPPNRTLMGPGPSDVHPRVLRAMSTPLVGHLDPSFVEIMDEVQELLRYTFRTDNQWTIPVSGTGSAAMEAAIGNVVEPGETMLVPTNGYFGGRMASMARRAGGEVVEVDAPWGATRSGRRRRRAGRIRSGRLRFRPRRDEYGRSPARRLGAHRRGPRSRRAGDRRHRHLDRWRRTPRRRVGIDVAYAGPQKCLSCPPGASPLTLSDEAMEKVLSRGGTPFVVPRSLLARGYWGDDRSYHHTAPITNVYAIREALRLVAEESRTGGHATSDWRVH